MELTPTFSVRLDDGQKPQRSRVNEHRLRPKTSTMHWQELEPSLLGRMQPFRFIARLQYDYGTPKSSTK